MKKWKINVGIIVVVGVLAMALFLGKTENIINSSAEELVEGVNISKEKKAELAVSTNEPVEGTYEPVEGTYEPVASTSEPVEGTYEPVASTSEPVEGTYEPVTSTNEPVESTARPAVKRSTKPNALDDIAYKENVQEEEYIVNLVNNATKDDLTTADWDKCLLYLQSNYDKLMNNTEVDREKVESYVYGYSLVAASENLPSEVVNSGVVTTKAYSAAKVTEYTNKWWDSHNPKYPNFDGKGGDCANFVSQALAAGGKPMKGTDAANFANWFCRSTSNLKQISSTWRGADAFGHYWRANAKGYKEFSGDKYFKDRASFEPIYKYTSVGDAISFLNENGRPYHTVIVSYKNRKTEEKPEGNNMINFASHTSSHKWRSVYDYLKGTSTDIRVYDMY